MWEKPRLLLAIVAFGCGPTRVELPDDLGVASTGGAGAAGLGGSSELGGSAGLDGSGVGGRAIDTSTVTPPPPPPPAFPAAPHAAIECDNPTPHPTLGGFIDCGDGSWRRPVAAECVSHLPFVPVTDTRVGDECTLDTDCPGAHDYCEWGLCQHGCITDAECGGTTLCLCGEPVGHCVAAACRADSTCPADYPCTGSSLGAGIGFACQNPDDQCLVDDDCRKTGAGNRCVLGTPRTCTIVPG